MDSPIRREPVPALKPFVSSVWASARRSISGEPGVAGRERMIPSDGMHLVFRLSGPSIRIFRSVEDEGGDTFPCGAVAGIRSSYYVKDVAPSAPTVGAALLPGACEALFRTSADEMCGRHFSLEDLWGDAARSLSSHLEETSDLGRRLRVLELFLEKRLPRVSGIHPAVAHALNRFRTTTEIGRVVAETGYSHRHFIQLFRKTVGLSPRVYTRLVRFQRTIDYGFDRTAGRWIDVALEAGYADQAHFSREFREITGISPTEYALNLSDGTRHVRIPGQFRSIPTDVRQGIVGA